MHPASVTSQTLRRTYLDEPVKLGRPAKPAIDTREGTCADAAPALARSAAAKSKDWFFIDGTLRRGLGACAG
jgi:hypothetical protein